MKKSLLNLMGILCALLFSVPVLASPFMVHDVYARATVPGQSDGAAYLTIMNHGDQGDRLLGVSTPAAEAVELHSSHDMNGVSHMQQEKFIDIPVHGSIAFQPGSYHLMLVGLKAPLKVGDTLKLILKFQYAGVVELKVPVKPVGAAQETEHHHHSGDGGAMSY
jgi:copper(I)-binding protein